MAAASCAAACGAAAAMPGKRKGMGVSPAFSCFLFMVLALAGMATPAAAATYRVGDSAGWTIIGNVNYTAWAASKSFHFNDTIVFVYNKQFHNVLEVSKADYRACNPQSPLATHTSGNDSITIKRGGHRFFICGVPGHCAVGQKVDIRVPKRRAAAAAAPAPHATGPSSASSSPSSPSSPTVSAASSGSTGVAGGAAQAPQKDGAAQRVTGWTMVLVAVAVGAASVGLS